MRAVLCWAREKRDGRCSATHESFDQDPQPISQVFQNTSRSRCGASKTNHASNRDSPTVCAAGCTCDDYKRSQLHEC